MIGLLNGVIGVISFIKGDYWRTLLGLFLMVALFQMDKWLQEEVKRIQMKKQAEGRQSNEGGG